jgi:hypothetical protein
VVGDSSYAYNYAGNTGSVYVWTVTGGAIIGSATGSEVVVAWSNTSSGELCVIENLDECSGDEVCLSVNITGIIENAAPNIRIYPNPSNGEFRMDISVVDNGYFQVLDASGRQVLSGSFKSGSNEMNFSALSSGSYVIQSGVCRVPFMIVH